ncbi:MAG: glycosyltransferase [Crocinitomicaceae bacterium]|nr:glycosyltransferase [Crocinitomicaceae bacterium]
MKLFVILSRFPYPLEKGDKLRAYHQLKELHASGYEIHLCCLTDHDISEIGQKEIQKYCKELHVFKLNKLLIYINMAFQIVTSKPFQVGYFYQKRIAKKINKLIEQVKPDHIYCQLIRTAEYVKNIHDIPKTLDYMDALSKGMLRRAQASKGIRKYIFNIEGRRLNEYENRIFDYFNYHTIISEQDREFINHPLADKITVVENGIAEDFFDYKTEVVSYYDIVFVGNMNYPPNIKCAEFIVEEILPLMADDTQVILCGASPSSKIIQLGNNPNVTVTGWVDDIKAAYRSGKVFVAPLFIGSGLQNKLLEAMALEIPCVTTPLANNALNAEAEKEILIATDAQEFANAIQLLLGDEQKAFEIAQSGKTFVHENFSWYRSVLKLDKSIFNQKE